MEIIGMLVVILMYWGGDILSLGIYIFVAWFIYRKFLKAKITSKAIKILIISILCLLPFCDRIAANIEGHYYLLTTPKPKDDIEVKYPFSLYYNTEPSKTFEKKVLNLQTDIPLSLDGKFTNKVLFNGDDNLIHMYSGIDGNLDEVIKQCKLKRKEIEEHFSKLEDNAKNGAEKILARQNTPICKMLEEKRKALEANYKSSKEIFFINNMPNVDYTFTRELKEHFFISVYDEKVVDNKTNEIVFFRREVFAKNAYWLLLHNAQFRISGGLYNFKIGSRYYIDKFKSIFANRNIPIYSGMYITIDILQNKKQINSQGENKEF